MLFNLLHGVFILKGLNLSVKSTTEKEVFLVTLSCFFVEYYLKIVV